MVVMRSITRLTSTAAAARFASPIRLTLEEVDDDTCDLSAPRAGSCWTRTYLPRGVRVRKDLVARNMRRSMNSMPSALLAFLVTAHVIVWPIAMSGMHMLQPTAQTRVADRAFREGNEDALQAIWSLVEGMHYGDAESQMLWGEETESLNVQEVRAALRSENAFGRMTSAMIAALQDPYSSYASKSDLSLPPSSQSFGLMMKASDKYEDALTNMPPRLLVTGVSPDSSAERAGLRMGDSIVEIGGIDKPAGSLSQDELRQILRGGSSEEGADSLSLKVHRAEGGSRRQTKGEWITLQPSRPFQPLTSKLLADGKIGYIRINQFTEQGTADLGAALTELRTNGAAGWVLDLRNNPGGQLTEAMLQAAQLLPDSSHTVAYTVDAAGYHEDHTAKRVLMRQEAQAAEQAEAQSASLPTAVSGSSLLRDADPLQPLEAQAATEPLRLLLPQEEPIIVLVDSGTASAAELFAAALRDNGRATLLGENTFGKGLIQRVYPLPNGGALKLTIGEYLTPKHEHIKHGVGLKPDLMCSATPQGERDPCLKRAATMARKGAPQQVAARSGDSRPQLAFRPKPGAAGFE